LCEFFLLVHEYNHRNDEYHRGYVQREQIFEGRDDERDVHAHAPQSLHILAMPIQLELNSLKMFMNVPMKVKLRDSLVTIHTQVQEQHSHKKAKVLDILHQIHKEQAQGRKKEQVHKRVLERMKELGHKMVRGHRKAQGHMMELLPNRAMALEPA